MSEEDHFIYPSCPVCDVKTDRNGVDMSDMKTGVFLFKCYVCEDRSEGVFSLETNEVYWTKIDIPLLTWTWLKILHRW